jgi:Zn-dependent alcohol dehydrogenase
MTDPVPTMKSTATISDGENAINATALVGVDLNQKGMQTAQQFGAASTYGKKYALGNLLLIDDTEDADAQKPSKAVDKIKQAAKPVMTKAQFDKAKEYLQAGGDITAIEAKYKINTQHLVELNKLNGKSQADNTK